MSPDTRPGSLYPIMEAEFQLLAEKRMSIDIPDISIELVNKATQAAFPPQFGTIIPILRKEDITVLPDADVINFQQSTAIREAHPYRAVSYAIEGKELGGSGDLTFCVKESQAMIQVLPIPGFPIIYPENDLTVDNKVIVEIGVIKSLLHETFHRTVVLSDPQSVDPSNPLFKAALAVEILKKNAAGDYKTKKAAERNYRRLRDYAATHNPHVVTEGARVILFCEDDNGNLKRLVESGYDLNEAIVERLTFHSLPTVKSYVEETSGKEFEKKWYAFLVNLASTNSTYRYKNMLIGIDSYLKRLKIRTPEELLFAFSNNEIASLHLSNNPQDLYSS